MIRKMKALQDVFLRYHYSHLSRNRFPESPKRKKKKTKKPKKRVNFYGRDNYCTVIPFHISHRKVHPIYYLLHFPMYRSICRQSGFRRVIPSCQLPRVSKTADNRLR